MKKISLIISFILLISVIITPLHSFAYEPQEFEVQSKSVVFASIDIDKILYSKDENTKSYPASLTKLLTAVVVVENCSNIDEKVTVHESDFSELSGSGLTVANLKEGEEISIRDLLGTMLVSSSADSADVLAVNIGGSIEYFVKMMNETAKKIGMTNSHFVNTHGMHDEDHYTTATDMYKLASYVLKMPIIYDICCKTKYVVEETNKSDERIFNTTNMMMNEGSAYYYKYANGLKTGFTTPAGRCLISTASYEGYHYLCVILGGDDDSRSEFTDSKNLYRWAFLDFEYRELAPVTEQLAELKVKLSWDNDHVQLFPEKTVSAIIPSGIDNSSIIYDFVSSYDEDGVSAPIKKGQVLGYARFVCAGQEIAKVNLVAGEDIDRNFLLLMKETATSIFDSTIFKVLCAVLIALLLSVIVVNIIHNKRKRASIKRVTRIKKY